MSLAQHIARSHFYALSAEINPALAGDQVPPPGRCLCVQDDNRAVLQTLYANLSESYPEAGMPYWSVRTWGLMVWQPIILTVIGVHGAGVLPPLGALRQNVGELMVSGYSLPEDGWEHGPEAQLLQRGGQSLRALCDSLLAELRAITPIKPLNALRLVADSLLSAIARLDRIRPELARSRRLELARTWLQAMGLEGQSSLMPLPLPDGRTTLVLDRKGCCMHYRRHDGELCATCPKLKGEERLARLRQELMNDA
ncbi:siderophore ferric iron reductase [Marinobacter halodurans]|uniref:Siderophore ferric iron reductase n=1 Tax=Marinobacter halodurans TaxID=2528979 RepID=A0ABY1ZMA4_9GAMM|nr:siderophore ferric iron reductase [Marinobacter halodurans]TBW53772.1 siderophore ferric iron reductase [Marinobacter halodurans]